MYQKGNPSSTYQFIPYYLDHNKLTLAINSDFLNAQIGMGDVIIDPLVQDVGTLKKDTDYRIAFESELQPGYCLPIRFYWYPHRLRQRLLMPCFRLNLLQTLPVPARTVLFHLQ